MCLACGARPIVEGHAPHLCNNCIEAGVTENDLREEFENMSSNKASQPA